MSRFRSWSLLVLTAATLGLAGCSSSSSSPSTTGAPTTTAAPVVTVPVQSPSPAGTFGTKPTVTVPPGAPPTQLQSTDLIVGTGPAVKSGDNVTVQYVGVAYSTKQQFDASWDHGQPYSFVVSTANVIPGWAEGVVGMKAGGRRELVIPPALGYGANPPPGSSIAPNETLVFIVDLVKIG
jgi:peptidylprolyl isomerase